MTDLDLTAHRTLLREFVEGRLDAPLFHSRYLELFKREDREMDEQTYAILNELFYVVEAWVEDPELRDEEDADDAALLAAAKAALERL